MASVCFCPVVLSSSVSRRNTVATPVRSSILRRVCQGPRARLLPFGRRDDQHSERRVQARVMYKEDPVPLDPGHPELVNLKNQADFKKVVSGAAFAAQLGLTGLSAVALYFSFAAHPATAGPTWHRLFTTVGIAIGFMTLWFSHVFIGSATKMQGGEPVSPSWISGNLLRCMVFNITAIVLLAVGLQASVGALGFQSLAISAAGPGSAAATAVAVVGVDVLSLQAITTCLLSHAVSLAHLNAIFRMVRAARYPRGGVVMGSMDGMALKSVDGP